MKNPLVRYWKRLQPPTEKRNVWLALIVTLCFFGISGPLLYAVSPDYYSPAPVKLDRAQSIELQMSLLLAACLQVFGAVFVGLRAGLYVEGEVCFGRPQTNVSFTLWFLAGFFGFLVLVAKVIPFATGHYDPSWKQHLHGFFEIQRELASQMHVAVGLCSVALARSGMLKVIPLAKSWNEKS